MQISYHIKYMFVGDLMKNEVDSIIRRLQPALQMRLRFIAHLSIEEIQSSWDLLPVAQNIATIESKVQTEIGGA